MRSSWWSEPPHQTNTPCAEKEGLTKTPNKHYSSWNKSSSNHLADCISYVCILVSFEINTPVCVFVKKSYFTIYKEICFFFLILKTHNDIFWEQNTHKNTRVTITKLMIKKNVQESKCLHAGSWMEHTQWVFPWNCEWGQTAPEGRLRCQTVVGLCSRATCEDTYHYQHKACSCKAGALSAAFPIWLIMQKKKEKNLTAVLYYLKVWSRLTTNHFIASNTRYRNFFFYIKKAFRF